MKITYHNSKFLKEELLEVLERFYNVEELRAICLNLIFPFLDETPPERKMLKQELISVVYQLLDDRSQFLELLDFMPKRLRKALTVLAWEGDTEVGALEKLLGFPITRRKKKQKSYFYNQEVTLVERLKEFHFIAVEDTEEQYHYRRSQAQTIVRLPRVLRQLLCEVLPEKPKGYELEFNEELECDGTLRFSSRKSITKDLYQVSDFIERGHVKTTQRGTPNKASLRKIAALCNGKEFYVNTEGDAKLELVRTSLLVSLLRALPEETRKQLACRKVSPAHFRKLVDFLDENPKWIFNNLLAHLNGRDHSHTIDYDIWLHFQEFIRNLQSNKWVTWENIQRYYRYRGLRFRFWISFNLGIRLAPGHAYTSHYHSDYVYLSDENDYDLFDQPLIQGYCFLLAALGFAEIAYTLPPSHERCPPKPHSYLTPFDGIKAVRLTKEGSYALGFDEELQFESLPDPRTRISLNPNCLNAICHDVDAVTELTLLVFMDRISPGHYRMTRKSFLSGCQTQGDARKRLEDFRQNVAETFPPLWEEFFEQTIDTCVALKKLSGYSIFQLEEDDELRKRFTTDPILRSHCLKVEGFKVLIENSKVTVVQKHLKAHGYISL